MKIYQYPKCSTCRKALKWLDQHGLKYESVDLVDRPPSLTQLTRLWKTSGLPIRKFFNTSGQSYRQGGFKEALETMTDRQALTALAADGKLIRRPIVDGGDFVLVGFDEAAYEKRFA